MALNKACANIDFVMRSLMLLPNNSPLPKSLIPARYNDPLALHLAALTAGSREEDLYDALDAITNKSLIGCFFYIQCSSRYIVGDRKHVIRIGSDFEFAFLFVVQLEFFA